MTEEFFTEWSNGDVELRPGFSTDDALVQVWEEVQDTQKPMIVHVDCSDYQGHEVVTPDMDRRDIGDLIKRIGVQNPTVR